MGVVFDEVIASVETPAEAPTPDSAPAASESVSQKQHEIIDAVEAQQRRARRLLAD